MARCMIFLLNRQRAYLYLMFVSDVSVSIKNDFSISAYPFISIIWRNFMCSKGRTEYLCTGTEQLFADAKQLLTDAVSDGYWVSTLCRPMVQVLCPCGPWLVFGAEFVLLMYPKSQVCFPCMKSLLLTWLWAKIAIFVGYLMGGWWIFVAVLFESNIVYKALSSKKCRISAKVSSKKCDYLLQWKYFLHQPII